VNIDGALREAMALEQLQDPGSVAELLDRTRASVDGIAGAIVASRDGLVVATSFAPELAGTGVNDPVPRQGGLDVEDASTKTSAMAAVAAGLGTQFVQAAGSGTFQAVTFEGSRSCTGVFPLTSALLLVLVGGEHVTMGRFVVAAKQAVTAMLGPQD
jgi:uncharacterized protein